MHRFTFKPILSRRYTASQKQFSYDVHVWEYEIVCEALKEAGFSDVELHSYTKKSIIHWQA